MPTQGQLSQSAPTLARRSRQCRSLYKRALAVVRGNALSQGQTSERGAGGQGSPRQISAVLCVAGCTVGPKYQRASAPAAAHWDVAEPWRESAPKDALGKGEWWTVFHDDELNGQPVETLTSADVPAQRVSDLGRFAAHTTMILEVKRGDWVDALLKEIGAWQKIVVASFDHSLIAELARRKVHFPLGITVSGVIVDLPDYAQRLGARWCFPDHHYVDAELVAALHAAAIDVVPWTPNRAEDWMRLREIGCDGVITDYPAEAVKWRAKLSALPKQHRGEGRT